MLKDYLNQTAIWKSTASKNAYGESNTSTFTINCRKVDKQKLVISSKGTETVSNAVYWVLDNVLEGDFLDDKLVVAIEILTLLEGDIEGYKVYVK